MNEIKYSTQIQLFNSYFDCNNELKPQSVLSVFQDVASEHGEQIGVGYLTMLEKNLFWVLSRVKYDVVKMPKINQIVLVETWPHEKGRIDFDRDYLIKSLSGEVLVKGTSKWCVIDTKTRTLSRTDAVEYTSGQFVKTVNYEERFSKVPSFEVDNLTPEFVYSVQHSDLDHNEHMNNTNYANLIVNAIKEKRLTHFEISFVSECRLNDQIKVYFLISENQQVCGYVNNKLVFNAMVK
ncbi:MAG: hypothetical protein IJE91_01560 [Clostridia bacterium]|nr:hypothetical protein [Clostridia bacterium]